METQPLVEQLLMICPQHSKTTIENTVNSYSGGDFGLGELLQICLDDLVDLPDVNQIHSHHTDNADSEKKIDHRSNESITLEFSEPDFVQNSKSMSTPTFIENKNLTSISAIREDPEVSLPSIGKYKESPLPRSISSPKSLSKTSTPLPESKTSATDLSSAEAVASVIKEANDIYNSFSRSKKNKAKRKIDKAFNDTSLTSTVGRNQFTPQRSHETLLSERRFNSPHKIAKTHSTPLVSQRSPVCINCGKESRQTLFGVAMGCMCLSSLEEGILGRGQKRPTPASSATSTKPATDSYVTAKGLEDTLPSIGRYKESPLLKQPGSISSPKSVYKTSTPSSESRTSANDSSKTTEDVQDVIKEAYDIQNLFSRSEKNKHKETLENALREEIRAEIRGVKQKKDLLSLKSNYATANAAGVSLVRHTGHAPPASRQSATKARPYTASAKGTDLSGTKVAQTMLSAAVSSSITTPATVARSRTSTTPTAHTAVRPGTNATPLRPGTSGTPGVYAATAYNNGTPLRPTATTSSVTNATLYANLSMATPIKPLNLSFSNDKTPTAPIPATVMVAQVLARQAAVEAELHALNAKWDAYNAKQAEARLAATVAQTIPAATQARPPADAENRPQPAVVRPPAAAYVRPAPPQPPPPPPPPPAAKVRPPAAVARPPAAVARPPAVEVNPRPPVFEARQPIAAAGPAHPQPRPAGPNNTANGNDGDMIMQLFPDVDPIHIESLQRRFLGQGNPEMITNLICNDLLENGYPKRAAPNAEADPAPPIPLEPKVDYYTDSICTENLGNMYHRHARKVLEKDFSKIRVADLNDLYEQNSYSYAKTRKTILELLKKAGVEYKETCNQNLFPHREVGYVPYARLKVRWSVDKSIQVTSNSVLKELTLLKNERKVAIMHDIDPTLRKELHFVHDDALKRHEKADLEMATQLNVQDYEETGQSIECGCCYGDYPFEDMVQCFEGHLFCATCLKSYTQEAVFGQGQSRLQCMSEDCEAGYPRSMMERVLTPQIIEKFEEREQFEALNLADIENLFKCPACQFAAIIEPQVRVFVCQNPSCKKECCTQCKEDWKDHMGKRCEEVEKNDETKLRLEAEEKMTQAKIRVCSKCKKGLVKSDGCNKMTCTCGTTMCYICRHPQIDYKHFCQHVREPGKGCTVCKACSLWTNPDQDDERAIEEIRQKAVEDAKNMGFAGDKYIGAPEEPPAKKRKTNNTQVPAVHHHPQIL